MEEAFPHPRNTIALVEDFYEINLRMKNSSFEILSKKQITAPSDMQYRTRQFLKFYINKIRNRIIFNEAFRFHLHPEGVHLCKILVVLCLYHSLYRSPVKPGMTIALGMTIAPGMTVILFRNHYKEFPAE